MRTAAILLLLPVLLMLGCQSASESESAADIATQLPSKHPVHFFAFDPAKYPAVHAAAIETLRSHGFRIARNDYRFGTITTYPKEAATTAEFWVDDASTYAQRRSDTYNAQQRTVSLKITNFAPGTSLDELLSEGEHANPTYYLSVEVSVQRLQRPQRYLTHSASPRITASYSDVPLHLKNRGIDGPFAQPLDTDKALERRLLDLIKAAAAQ